jgi:cell division protein ZipA
MDTLRIILVIVGVAIIAAVYFMERSRRKHAAAEHALEEVEPLGQEADDLSAMQLDAELERLGSLVTENRRDEADPELPAPAPRLVEERESVVAERTAAAPRASGATETPSRRTRRETPQPQETAGGEDKLIVLHVVARGQDRFPGDQVIAALEEADLVYGKMRIFHRYPDGEEGDGVDGAVFSVANMLNPGWFDLDRAEALSIKGVTLFLQLPGPVDGMAAFDDMLRTAERLALRLNGELWDERRSVLSRQTVEHLREEIQEFQRRQRLAQRPA